MPKSPNEIEQVEALTHEQRQDFHFSISREIYARNGVPFVKAMEGESYASIASANNLFLREILKFNDLSLTTDMNARLQPGTLVYVQAKKKMAAKGIEKHVIEADDTLRGIAQRYGVSMKSICRMNGLMTDGLIREGDIVRLRK